MYKLKEFFPIHFQMVRILGFLLNFIYVYTAILRDMSLQSYVYYFYFFTGR